MLSLLNKAEQMLDEPYDKSAAVINILSVGTDYSFINLKTI